MKNLSVLTQRTLIVTSTTTIDAVSLPSIGIGSHQIKRTHIAWIWMKINKIGKMGFSIWNRMLKGASMVAFHDSYGGRSRGYTEWCVCRGWGHHPCMVVV
ncbi:unnamed protein product [Lactuca virosa]|uniref:Uncharacterized protein n=1 Tax=Lactuca virosa TaxID=75947 RepID=A0AAU9MYX4_9ASTR|nr:unnamed protein product [Lactuca virosa]